MGEYTEPTAFEIHTEQSPIVQNETKVRPCYFPLLTNGVIIDSDMSRKGTKNTYHVTPINLGRLSNSDSLRAFCDKHTLQIPTLFQLAWSVVLSSYIGTENVGFVVVKSRKDRHEIGFCEVELKNENAIIGFLKEVEKNVEESSSTYNRIPSAGFQIPITSEGSHAFNSVVLFQERDGELSVSGIEEGYRENYFINIAVRETALQVEVELSYPSTFLPQAHAKNVASTFSQALLEIVQQPQQSIREMDLVSPTHLSQIWEWNKEMPKPVAKRVNDLIEAQARRRPQAQAIVAEDGDLTYGMLSDLSTKLAHHLISLGIGLEYVVPLCFEKSKWAIVAMLAVVKAGAAIVNLDAGQPMARLTGLLDQMNATMILSSRRNAELWQDRMMTLIVDEDNIAQLAQHAEPPVTNATPQNTLYVIFTSGSTGTPKGCVIEHESFLTAAAEHIKASKMTEDSRLFQGTPYTFDVSMLEIFTALSTGACVCSCGDELMKTGLANVINTLRITWTFMTPSLVRLIEPAEVPSLKTLALGGEALSATDVRVWADRLHLCNGYGPTETSVAAALNPGITRDTDPLNIGRGAGALCWVVKADDHHSLVPIGAVGELIIQGPIVARGYFQNPEKTREVFINQLPAFASKLAGLSPARLYKTGDLVRLNSDGTIAFIGRKDKQVKLRGQRLELGEIEHHINLNSHVRHGLVVLPKSGHCSERLVAVMSLHDFPSTSTNTADINLIKPEYKAKSHIIAIEVRESIRPQLTTYMLPTVWVVLESLPLTTSGKINGRAVSSWLENISKEVYNEIAGVTELKGDENPTSEMEKIMQNVWSEVLNIPASEIGLSRSFISIGGDSITAMKVVTRLRLRNILLAAKDIFQSKSLSEVATRAKISETSLVQAEDHDRPAELSTAQRIATVGNDLLSKIGLSSISQVEDVFICSPMQESIVLTRARFPGTYEIQKVIMLESQDPSMLKTQHIQSAWQKVVDRHQSLRSIIVTALKGISGNAVYHQIILKHFNADVVETKFDGEATPSKISAFLRSHAPPAYGNLTPEHRLTICNIDDKKSCIMVDVSHAVVDGLSAETILQDLALALEDRLPSGKGPLYGDYISHIQRMPEAESIAHWKHVLASSQPTIVPMYGGDKKSAKKPRSTKVAFSQWAELQQFCAANGVTISNVIQTAWALTLKTYTGSEEVLFGYMASGRDLPVAGIEEAVGVYLTMLVCHLAIDERATISELVQNIQENYMAGHPHQYTPLGKIQNALNMQGSPLFNTIMSLYKPAAHAEGGVITLNAIDEVDPCEFDIAVGAYLTDHNINISLSYWSSTMSDSEAANIARTFSGAISAVLKSASTKVEDLDLFNEHDQAQISKWNSKEPLAVEGLVHEYVKKQVLAQPDAPAVCSWDGDFTYRELDRLSDRLAFYLSYRGVGAEVLVPHCFDKSKWSSVVTFAIMKAGGAGVGLSPSHPVSRLSAIIEDCGSKIILVAPQHAHLFKSVETAVILVDSDYVEKLPGVVAGSRLPKVHASNPAFVSFTSGSTGKPKGIILEHRSLITSIMAHGTEWEIRPGSRVIQFSAYAFDAAVSDTFTTLVKGGCICIPSEHERTNDLIGAINRMNVNWAFLTPRVLGTLSPKTVPTLKTVVLGGEAISSEDVDPWTKDISLRIVYGPTECTIYSMGTDPLTPTSDPTSLGHGIGTRVWVTDSKTHDKLAPVGVIGELLIEGPLVTRGYLNEPEKTKASFIEDPKWMPREVGMLPRRFYKTNDLVRYLPGGDMMFIGRKDTQVKIRGQRVELGEIEHAILQNLDTVLHVSVDSVIFPSTGQTLVAFLYLQCPTMGESTPEKLFLQLDEPMTAVLRQLEKTLIEYLPTYMVPSLFIPIGYVPMTLTAKVDRKLLKLNASKFTTEEFEIYSLASQHKTATTTTTEKQLQHLWAEVLNKDPGTIGANDSFFRLGGDSITAMKLVTAAREVGMIISVADIFQAPELSKMAAILGSLGVGDATEAEAPRPFELLPDVSDLDALLEEISEQYWIPKENIHDVYPCTPLQEALVAISTTQPGAYVAQNVFRLPPDMDLERFKSAWQTMVDIHAIFRTRVISPINTRFLQVILRKSIISWEEASSLEEYLEQDMNRPILYGAELVRYGLVNDEKTGHFSFVWTAHHAVYDGWTIPIVLEQVVQIYKNEPLPTEAPFSHFIKHLEDVNSEASKDFWRSQLSGDLPASFPKLPNPAYQPRSTETMWHKIDVTPKAGSGITLAIVLRAAWAIVVARYADSSDIVYGLTLSGRDMNVPGIHKTLGPTITTVPVKVHVDPQLTVENYLAAIQKQSVDMMAYQHMGLQNIKRVSTEVSEASDFKNLFCVQPESDDQGDFLGMELMPSNTVGFDTYALLVECNFKGGRVAIKASFDSEVIPSDQINRLLYQFEKVVMQVNGQSATTILEQIDLFSEQDRQQVWDWNSVSPMMNDECVTKLVRQQVLRRPNAIAVDSWDGSLTYRALDDLSSRMAYFLRHTMGVKPEVLVPMCFDKSVWTVVAIVSVVKAGGAYVMLNPEHPISRIRDLLEDVNSHLLLTAPEHQHLFDLLPQTATPINEAFIKGLPSVSPSQMSQIRVQPHHPAAMIFTSGSTGKPKGILLYHNALSTVSTQHGRGLGWGGKNARHLQFANYTFDASVAEIFFTLMHGGTICMISEYERINNLAGAMRDMRITCVFLTPTVAALVDPRDVPDLQTIILGGEQIQRALIDRWSPYVRTINSYGPSECTIWTSHMDAGDNVHSSNIGFGYGSRLWIVEPKDHNRLTPVGCIGELLIEGPIVAQGYLKELEKTKASFIDSPPWMEEGSSGTHRLYKTGDLVRYASNGSLIIVGRKDTQVKFHGQRIELGEIEFHIQEQPEIEIGMVVMPKLGLAKGKLVAVLIIKEFNPLIAEGEAVKLLKPEFKERARDIITEIKLRLADKLPPYMIPSTWMVLNSIPRTTSGKLNRVPITKWIHEMGKEQYLEINDATRIKNKEPTTSMEKQLMEVVSHVLDIPADNIGANRSFLSLGGDSITAMQVVSRCRAAKIALSVEDILKSKSLVEMATRAKLSSGPSVSKEEEFDVPFELSPVQQLYFKDIVPLDASLKCGIQYNQNVLARFTRRVREPDVSRAITEIVKLHSMLRTTFGQNANGKWMQTVRQGTTKSHVFESHNATTREQMMKLVNKRQSGMDIRKGPLFGVDLFNMKDGCQLISLCAHHLVIDLVSWRVILQNLEELLESKKPNIETPLPFQTWNRLQIMQAQTFKPAESLPAKVPAANFSYWNMSSPPTWKNVDEVSFILKEEATSQLFGSANDALQTEPVEILLAVLQQSFRQAFKDRDAPAVFCEGHGRETWDSEIDPSTTVGWFTTFSPIYVSGSSKPETLDLVRRTKDVRRKIPKNGWKYFNCRHFSPEGIEAFRHHSNMEICFNYMGRYQQLEREGALIRQEALQEGEAISFVGEATRRLAIFDVSAVVTNRKLHFSFFFNRGTSHMAKIRDWINKCEELIYSMVQDLIKAPKQHTLSDFPLVSMDYEGLSEFSSTLKEIGIANSNIEDLYPASAVQEGILISQARSPSTYKVRQMYKILSNDQSLPINVARIRAAWQQVVDYHAVFRTIFLDTFDGSGVGLYDQLVLKEFPADVKLLQFDGEGLDVVAFLEDQPSPVYTDKLPPHRVTLCEAKDGIYMHWEISHSLIDGASLAVVMKDFTLAYEGLLPSGKGPLYSDFIRYLQRQPESASLEYWAGYLADIEPCFFPRLREGPTMAKSSEPKSIVVNLDIECDLQKFCENHELTVGNLIQAAWGLVLKLYTGSNKVCFGHMTSGRDVPLDNVYDAVGPYINLLVCNMDFSEDIAVDKLLFNLQHDYLESFPHQHTALGKIQKVLGNQGIKLFNTFINLQRSNPAGPEPRISLDVVGQMDPTDYDLSLYITTGGPDVELVLTYLESYIPEDRAVNIVNTFSTILKCLLSHYDSSVGSLDFVSQQDKEQIKVWNHATPRQVDNCIHTLIAEQALDHPHEHAVISWVGDATFTYQELNHAANRLAQHLHSLGVGPEVLVPLCLRKSAWSIVTILAVLKAGGSYVMLSNDVSQSYLQTLIKDPTASLVIVSPEYTSQFMSMGVNTVSIDRDAFDKLPFFTGFSSDEVSPSNAAMVIYSSGSSTAPRGTVIEHSSITTMAIKHGPTVALNPRASVLQFAPYTSEVSNPEILATLINGGCICIPSDEESTSDICGAIKRMEVNCAFLTPTIAKMVNPSDVPSLQTLVLSGEPVTAPLLQKWQNVQMVNSYGLSECSVWTSNAWQKPSGAISPSNIGRGIASRLWIAEPSNHHRLVPVGAIGELLIDGPLVARGYVGTSGNADTTFVSAPAWFQEYCEKSATLGSTRLVRTGDLVRYNSNGTLNFIGRSNSQVKLNGQRIELNEIEGLIASILSGSQQVAVEVVTVSARQNKKILIAFFSGNTAIVKNTSVQESILSLSEDLQKFFTTVKAEIGRLLPQYMMPNLFVPLSSLPLTSSLKLNRPALQDLGKILGEEELSRYSLAEAAKKKTALSAKGKVLSAIWARVLGIPVKSIGVNDHFFRLGGDSISAMKVVTVSRTEGFSLTVADIFQTPTLSAMCKALKKLGQATESSMIGSDTLDAFSLIDEIVDIEPLAKEAAKLCGVDSTLIEDMYPCTPAQEILMAVPGQTMITNVSQNAYEIPSSLDLARFQRAWETLFVSSPILRTRIISTTQGVFQVVLKEELSWQNCLSLEQYLEESTEVQITYGTPLIRFAIVGRSKKTIVWTAHNAIYDATTTSIIVEQIASIYERDTVLDVIAYNQFVRSLTKIDADSVVTFWREQLAQESSTYPALPYAAYEPRTNMKTIGTLHASRTDPEVPLTMVLRAAWAIVLSVYADTNDVIFGATSPGCYANVGESMAVMGPTSSTVPVQISLNHSKTIPEYLRQVNRQYTAMIPFQHTGLDNIRQINKEASNAFYLQNLFIVHPSSDKSEFMGMAPVNLKMNHAHPYGLVIECNLNASIVEVQVMYDSNLLQIEQADRIIHQFKHVANQLNAVDMNSSMKLEDVEIFTSQDLQQIVEWNTARPEMIETCVHTLFEEQACKRPNASAVEGFDGNFTYAQLNDMATRLSQFLVSRGVKREDKIPVCYNKSTWVIVAMFGIMKSGGTCVMLNPDNPVERVRGIIEDLDCKMVLCDSPSSKIFTTLLPSSGIILMDESFLRTLPLREMAPIAVQPSNAVLVVYTSGSTGKPKGIVLEHQSIATGLLAHGIQMGIGMHTRTFQFAAYTFDVSLEEIITTLILGGTVCVPSEFDRMNDIAGAMARMRVNWTELTPTVASLLDPSMVPTLKTLALSGESVTKEVVEIWADYVQMVNTYGPSECSVSTSCNIHLAKFRDISNIGQGFGCKLWVVDPRDHNKLAPIGGVGELLVEGPIVAREYWNDVEKTTAAFVYDLAWAKDMPGNPRKFYKTGDLVKYNPDSSIKFIGRRDTQVKLHGQRIEMGEIEYQVKAALPGSSYQVAVEVLTPESRGKNKMLAAFFCKGNSTAIGTDFILPATVSKDMLAELMSKLELSLPAYMVPTIFVPLGFMPLSTSGKLDRKTIRQVANKLSYDDLASYSLSVVKLLAKEVATSGSVTAMERGLKPFTLLSKQVDVLALRNEAARQCGVTEEWIQDIYPCTPLQEGLMVRTAQRENAYVSQTIYRLPDGIDLEKFQIAGNYIRNTQSILRTRIIYTGTQALQVVVAEAEEWHSAPTLEAYKKWDKETPMTYGAPLVRYGLVNGRATGSETFFIYTAHHSVYDGWSDALLVGAFEAAYTHGVEILPKATQYNQFIQFLEKIDLAASNKFWQHQLSGAVPTSFPQLLSPDFEPNPDKQQTIRLDIPARSGSAFTLTTVLKAAWSIVLGHTTDSSDVIFDHVLSGRNAPVEDIDGMIGPTICTVPLRVQFDRNTKAQQFLSDIQMQSIEMMPFEQAGIQNILRLPGVNATARSGNLLVVQPKMTGDTGPLGMKIVSKTPDDFETYALIVECHISDSSPTEVVVRFDERVVSEGEVSWMLTHFEAAARNLLLQPSSSLNELSLFGKKDIDQLIEWAGAPIPVKEACVHDLFQAQAGLQPFKQAIHAWDGDLTYSQLESQSQLIANHLQSIGVTQNSFVPLCFSKSIWAIISMIAVLKCGAAIVMLNPEYPAERLNEIVSQVEAKVILAGTNELSTVQDLAKTVLAVNADMVAELRPILVAKKLVVSPKSPVYVVFTSGSTGKPKGVVIEHQAFVTSAAYHAPMCKLDSNSRVLQFAAYTFDISMADIFTTLIVGGTICVLSDTDRTGDLAGAINRLDANWACLTATVAGLFGPSDVPNFKTLTLAGEAPTEGNVSTWGGKVNLVNAYGPSEASVYCCIQKEMTSAKSHLNCGTGSGLRLWITEPENPQKLVPVGSIGEMLIEGPTLARGYLGDAVKTAAAFIENPAWMNQYAQIGGARRLYRTGDMAKYNFDGTVEFCGRRDNQVKINGQRLETQEIEHHIRSRLSHLDVAVDAISLTAQGNRKILVAFFYPRDSVSGEWTADDIGLSFSSAMQNVFVELRSDLFRSIPSFMIPSLFIPLKGMPINTSFKLNRLVLRQLVNSLDEKSFRDFSLADVKKKAPSTQTEKQLASLWAEVLGTSKDAIGVTDNFFQLGGDSLVAMKLSSRLREAGITMTLANIFKNPRIVDAAAFLNDKPSSASHDLIAEAAPYKRFSTIENANMDAFLLAVSEKAGVQRNNIIDVLPTTTSQDIALVGILTDSRWMLNYYSFQGNGAVDLQRVQRACFELVQSLEILRTVFVLHEARFFQVVLKSLTPMFSVYETDQDIDAFAKGLYEDSFSRDIPLEDPFVQFVVIKQLHTLKHRIIMRLSHAQYDGASLPGIWQALKIAFEGQAIPETPGFARYASRSHALALEAASRDHWTQLLAGSSMTNIISRQAPELRKTSEKVTILSKTIRPQQLTTEAITFATIIKAAWSMTLAQLASKVDVVFGHTVNGRNLPVEGVENIVGPCLNIIPVRVTMQRNWKIIDLLNFIQSQQLNNLPFESIGYRDIVKNCTNWPTWTHFSSVVQHQSFEANEPTINLGGTSYTPGYMGTDLDMVDVSVLSSALDDNSTEISLMCSPTIPVEFAEELLEIVCKNTMSFTANPYSLLPMASTTMQAIPLSPGSPGSVASSRSFETLSKKDTAALVAVLQRTWSKVLRNAEEIRAESSIFELGGDVINVAQVAYLLREKSFEVSVEDLVRFPTLEGQVELLSTQARKARQILG